MKSCVKHKRKKIKTKSPSFWSCLCVIALTSIFTLKSNIDKINDTESESGVPVSEGAQVQQGQDDQNAEPEMSAEASSDIPTVDSRQPSAAPGEYLNPVNSQDAKVTNPYSMDTLIYSVTLDQYMTHCGIDIEAPADSQVVAVAEGTVTAIYNDDRYGLSVEITHPGHVITIYSNLADSSELVEVGRCGHSRRDNRRCRLHRPV